MPGLPAPLQGLLREINRGALLGALVLIGLIQAGVLPPGGPQPVQALEARLSTTSSVAWQVWDEGLPASASVLAVVADPLHPGVLYAGTHDPPGIWRSADCGETWTQEAFAADTGATSHPVYTLLWDGRRRRLWAGTTVGLFYRSANSSAWQPAAAQAGPIFHLTQDASGRLYAVQGEAGLFRLEDDGRWISLRTTDRGLSVGVSPDGRLILLGTAGDGLRISRDGGATWHQSLDFGKAFINGLWLDGEAGGQAVAATSKGLFRSGTQGRSWQPISDLAGRAFAFHLAPDGTLYAGLEGGVARSLDAGRTWSDSATGNLAGKTVLGLDSVVDHDTGYVLVAATQDGIYRSVDHGATWQRLQPGPGHVRVNAVVEGAGGVLIAATPRGLYRRPVSATAWQPVAPAFRDIRVYDLSAGTGERTFYAGTERGLLCSRDAGESWHEVLSELSSHGMPGVLVDPADSDHLWVRVAFERVYESWDGGMTWQARWEGMETHHVVLSLARSPEGELLAGSHQGLFRRSLQDDRWHQEYLPLPDQAVYAVAYDPVENRQYAGSTAGLWCHSQEDGWQRCGAGAIPSSVSAVVALPGGPIYAGTWYGGLYRSCDRGETWHRVAAVPEDVTVTDLLAPSDGLTVYAATDRGFFRGPGDDCPAGPTPQVDNGSAPSRRDVLSQPWIDASSLSLPSTMPAVHTLRPDDAVLQQAQAAGFQAIVQVFSWAEIEPAPSLWYWEYPDFLVRAAAYYDLGLILRLDHPPEWAVNAPPGEEDMPFDAGAYLDFVDTIARRYRGRVRGYIIWNEPNLASEWGAAPDPTAYARLLQRAYAVIKRADPLARVVSAGLAPTNERSEQALDERLFLHELYGVGAGPFFDALGVHPYGFAYPPDDPRGQHDGLNLNRILDVRDVMVAHGDGAKSMWATELGWTIDGLDDHQWLTVSPQQQADYLVGAWQMARAHWPWLDMFTVWNLDAALASSSQQQPDEQAGYGLLDETGEPKPALLALGSVLPAAGHGLSARAFWKRLVSLAIDRPTPAVVLAQDQEIHLGDNQ